MAHERKVKDLHGHFIAIDCDLPMFSFNSKEVLSNFIGTSKELRLLTNA